MLIGPAKQLALALTAPLALFALPRRTWGYFLLYLALCGVVLGGSAYFILDSEDLIRDLVLAYLFPESWHPAMGFVADRYLEAQSQIVLANLAVLGSLGMVAIFLFPFKEMLSASFEREAGLIADEVSEHPLWEQAWEEIKLFLAVIAVQGTIFWIGYTSGGGSRVVIAAVLGNVLTFAVYAVDFISPPFQRHQGHYSRILKTLACHPIASLGFGAIFAAPPLIATTAFASMRLETMIAWTCAINVIGIAWAAVAGTWLGSKLYPDFVRTRRSSVAARVLTWLVVGGLLVFNGYTFGSLTWSVHKKSQLLKCNYSLVWSSFEVDLPGLGSLLGTPEVGVSFDVEIENPTSVPVELEQNRIELRHRGDLLGTARLRPFRVDARSTARQRVGASLGLSPATIAKRNTSLLTLESWTITLHLQVAPGFEFPVYLVE